MLTAIRQWVIKTMMKNNTGVVQTLPKRDLIELNTQITAQRLMQNGVDPESLTNVNQVENVINQIDNPPKINIDTGRNQSGIRSTKSAKVMDMEGKEIPSGSKIMGGKQAETEAEIAARMSKENKESAKRLREKSIAKFETDQNLTELEKAIDNASPGFVGDRKYDAQLVADNLANDRFGKEFYDLDQKLQMNLYDEAYTGLSKQRFNQKQVQRESLEDFVDDAGGVNPDDPRGIDDFIPDPEDMAQGGRAGFKDGEGIMMAGSLGDEKDDISREMFDKPVKDLNPDQLQELMEELERLREKFRAAEGGRIGLKNGMDRRTFLKIMGGLASVPILGKFFKPAKVASKAVKAAPVVSKSTPPAYFFELAEKIKTLGRITDGPQERIKIHSMPAKDGKSELMLTEDIGTGEMQIKKIGKEEDMTTKVETMEYVPGSSQADETTQGIPADSYDEYTEVNSRIYKDEFNEPDIIDGIEVDEIIEEVKDQAPSIKKAGGGIARMLGE